MNSPNPYVIGLKIYKLSDLRYGKKVTSLLLMTIKKRASAIKPVRTPKKRGFTAMKLRYGITIVVVVCAIILGVFTAMGPKLSLQTPPIEAKAMQQINKLNLLQAGEILEGYKATSYYTYNSGVVITNKRVIAFYKDRINSIPLDKITLVIIKDTELGHQEVLISAEADGVIAFEMYHTDVEKLINMLHVSDSIVKHYARSDIKAAREDAKKGIITEVKSD